MASDVAKLDATQPRTAAAEITPALPAGRPAHPEVVRECGERTTGWRVDERGNWWPCSKSLEPPMDPDARRRRARERAHEEQAS